MPPHCLPSVVFLICLVFLLHCSHASSCLIVAKLVPLPMSVLHSFIAPMPQTAAQLASQPTSQPQDTEMTCRLLGTFLPQVVNFAAQRSARRCSSRRRAHTPQQSVPPACVQFCQGTPDALTWAQMESRGVYPCDGERRCSSLQGRAAGHP